MSWSFKGFAMAGVAMTAVVIARPQRARRSAEAAAERHLRKLNEEEVAAFLGGDCAALASLWAKEFVATNALHQLFSRRQLLDLIESRALAMTSFTRQIEYLRVQGDVAVIAGRETIGWGGQMPNKGMIDDLRFTAVWRKQAGVWRAIVRHASLLPQDHDAMRRLPSFEAGLVASGERFPA